jgi:hypothetical protein
MVQVPSDGSFDCLPMEHIAFIAFCVFSSPYNNYLCTYDLYSPVHNVWDACISITRGSGRWLGPGIQEFFGPCEMALS